MRCSGGLEAQNAQLQQEIVERRQAEQALETSRELIRRQRDELKALYDKIVAEQKVSERLLLNVLPYPIAERLKAHPEVIADSFQEATVLFADIVEFTRFSAGMSPQRLVAMLNEIFTDFDGIADHRGLEKIKTIGDAYMAAAGLPVPAADHAVRAAHMALDMLDALERFNARKLPFTLASQLLVPYPAKFISLPAGCAVPVRGARHHRGQGHRRAAYLVPDRQE